jgi:hypothetical protein
VNFTAEVTVNGIYWTVGISGISGYEVDRAGSE